MFTLDSDSFEVKNYARRWVWPSLVLHPLLSGSTIGFNLKGWGEVPGTYLEFF